MGLGQSAHTVFAVTVSSLMCLSSTQQASRDQLPTSSVQPVRAQGQERCSLDTWDCSLCGSWGQLMGPVTQKALPSAVSRAWETAEWSHPRARFTEPLSEPGGSWEVHVVQAAVWRHLAARAYPVAGQARVVVPPGTSWFGEGLIQANLCQKNPSPVLHMALTALPWPPPLAFCYKKTGRAHL